jgi:membrane-associated protease RseP (regulator of RpoE activity)
MSEITPPVSTPEEFQRPIEVFVVRPYRPRYWLHILLLLATIFTTTVMGARMESNFLRNLSPFYMGDGSLPLFPFSWAMHPRNLLLGLPFSLTLMLILMAHEMGHYVYCLRYGVQATLPFFIPFPSLIGTLGAFIRIRAPIHKRAALFDIGIAGPIGGLIVAIPMLFLSLGLAKPVLGDQGQAEINYPLIFHTAHYLLAHLGLGSSVSLQHLNLHPIAIAAWVGMLATALNLLPAGQLDGGHILFATSPRVHRVVSRLTVVALIPLGFFFWIVWLLWAIGLGFIGIRHPLVQEESGIIGGVRRWLAVLALVMLALTFTPGPFIHGSLPEFIHALRTEQ